MYIDTYKTFISNLCMDYVLEIEFLNSNFLSNNNNTNNNG